MNRMPVVLIVSFVAFLASAGHAADGVIDIRDLGAQPDGKTLSTAAIQKAIDQCAAAGGGVVRFPAGTWLSGTLTLRSHVTLELDAGATLLGSRNLEDYRGPRIRTNGKVEENGVRDLLVGDNLDQVAIVGEGTIDVNGDAFHTKEMQHKKRPKAIMLTGCHGVVVKGVTLRNAGSWMQHYRLCEDVFIRNITVFNHASYNNDGLDIDSCSNVTITDSTIDSDDDGLVIKSLSEHPCRNLTIARCTLSSHCNALKCGTESQGGFINVKATQCKISSPQHSRAIYGKDRGLAGIALEIVDGGRMENVEISDITIEGVTSPIFLRLGNRAKNYVKGPKPDVGTLQNVRLSRIRAERVSPIGCAIAGLPDHPIENVVLEDIRLSFDGGESRERASATIKERPEAYPESSMFGVLPAYGFYCRHVKGIAFSNVQLTTAQPDGRHAMVFDDAEDISIKGIETQVSAEACAPVRLTHTRNAVLNACKFQGAGGVVVQLQGNTTRRIVLTGNDWARGEKAVNADSDVARDAWRVAD
jgi:hypothetical protein